MLSTVNHLLELLQLLCILMFVHSPLNCWKSNCEPYWLILGCSKEIVARKSETALNFCIKFHEMESGNGFAESHVGWSELLIIVSLSKVVNVDWRWTRTLPTWTHWAGHSRIYPFYEKFLKIRTMFRAVTENIIESCQLTMWSSHMKS